MNNITQLHWNRFQLLLLVTLFAVSISAVGQDRLSPSGIPSPNPNVQPEKLSVAILPFSTGSRSTIYNDAEGDLKRFSVEFVIGQPTLELIYAYDWPGVDGGLGIGQDLIWEEDGARKVPKESQVYDLVERLGADIALTYFFAPRTGGWYDSDLYLTEVYVFDLKHKRLFYDSGDESSYKLVTERLFEKLISERASPTLADLSSSEDSTDSVRALQLLLLEGLISESEYREKRQILFNKQLEEEILALKVSAKKPSTRDAPISQATVSKGHRSVGILPMKLRSSSHDTQLALELETGKELQTLLAKSIDIKVEYSAYDRNSSAPIDTAALWEAQLFHPNVREEELRQLGIRLGVDYVVAAWLGVGYQPSGGVDNIPWPLDLSVLRVRDGELKVFKTNNKSLGPTVEELRAFVLQP